jgi:hypothetical protein
MPFLIALFMPLLWRFYSLLFIKAVLLLFCCFDMLLLKLIWCSGTTNLCREYGTETLPSNS